MKFFQMGKGKALAIVCAVGAVAAPLSVASTASAATSQAPMSILCTLSPAAQASTTAADLSTPASAAALCATSEAAGTASAPSPTAAAPVGPTPDNTVTGDCGSSYIYGYNDGSGNAKISTGLSVIAPIAYGSATVMFSINSENLYVSPNIGPDTWGAVIYHHTGTGPQTASLSADVQLTNGDVCYSGGPTTSYTVS